MMTSDAIENDPEEMIQVSKSFFVKAIADSDLLEALEEQGVNNWEGYSIAYKNAFGGEDD